MIHCPCGGELNLDLEETRKDGIRPVYNCSKCNNLLSLSVIGQKPNGWRTKKLLKMKEEIDNIQF